MPKILEIEYTPNPNVIRFILKEPITNGLQKIFGDCKVAEYDTLAKQLFAINGVAKVFMQNNYLVITKESNTNWADLLIKLAPPIRQSQSILQQPTETLEGASPTNQDIDNNDPFMQKVNEVIKERILPMLAADGGGLDVVGHDNKTIMIRYYGTCSSCPSGSTGTLMVIEDLLRQNVDPDIIVTLV